MVALPEIFLAAPLAHRALHDVARGRPENSRAAVLAACEAGYNIEIDVQLTADGAAVVFHDYSLERLAEAEGLVRAQPLAALQRMALRGGSEGIPSLREILDLVAGRVGLLIEIKDQDGQMGPAIGALEQAVLRDLAGYAGPVAVMSFNPHSVAYLHAHAALPLGLTTSAYHAADWPELREDVRAALRPIADYAAVGASFISHEVADLGSARVAELKAAGAKILCWTVRSAEVERVARQVADNITFERYLAEIK